MKKQLYSNSVRHNSLAAPATSVWDRRHRARLPGHRCHATNKLRPLLIDNYDSYTYNLYQIIAEVYGVGPVVVCNDAIDIGQVHDMLADGKVHHIILSPGPGSPDVPSDIGVCMDVLHTCADTPVLGVCLGHQALAAASGGSVVRAPEPVHGRLSTIQHTGHELFAGCPSGPGSGFDVVRYHSLVVDAASLPDALEPLAWTCGAHKPVTSQQQQQQHQQQAQQHRQSQSQTQPQPPPQQQQPQQPHACMPNHQQQEAAALQQPQSLGRELLMALMHKHRPHYGVQFHPESIATCYGIQLLINFRNLAYKHSGVQLPSSLPGTQQLLDGAAAAVFVGPPGRQLPPRPWPSQLPRSNAAAALESTQLAGQSCAHNGILQQQLSSQLHAHRQEQQQDHQHVSSTSILGPAVCVSGGAGLQLSWLRLPGLLQQVAGGTQALFSALIGPGPDTFWLDSSSAPERARFSYMGGASLGGPLWHHVTYRLPHQQQQAAPDPQHQVQQQQQQRRVSSRGLRSTCQSCSGMLCVMSGKRELQQARMSIWDYLSQQMEVLQLQPSAAASAAAALPFNFWGGFVGYLGYELKAECGGNNVHAADGPDAAWLFADRLLAVDHQQGDVYLLALHTADTTDTPACAETSIDNAAGREACSGSSPAAAAAAAAARQWLADVAAKASSLGQRMHASDSRPQLSHGTAAVVAAATLEAAGLQAQQLQQEQHKASHATIWDRITASCHLQPQQQQPQLQQPPGVRLRADRTTYTANVAACQAALHAGESYELCLTTAFEMDAPPQPWDYYTTLRAINPAPYSAWLSIGSTIEDASSNTVSNGAGVSGSSGCNDNTVIPGITVCCSSPERFLQGGRGGTLEAKPIKGTAARHPDDHVADAAAAASLLSSEKERAENLMIVDLLRNDLGKVCEPGSVHVPGLIQLESYATVHQLVSTVRGLRRTDASCVDALRAAFPGGSMTGAPKLRSMELLDNLEGAARGVYSGALGYLSVNDTFDMNIVIRSAVFVEQLEQCCSNTSARGNTKVHRNDTTNVQAHHLLSIGAGGAIVVQSDAEAEFAEMHLKAQQLLKAAMLSQVQHNS